MVDDVIRTLGFLCLGTRMKRLGERLQADTQQIIENSGMAVLASQFPYLAAIDRLGPLTIGDLAEAMGVTQPAVTRTVLQLDAAGLTLSEPSPGDQRRKIVRLSDDGRTLVDTASRSVWPQVEAAVRDLCRDLDGPLLSQLAAVEDGLAKRPLAKRLQQQTDEEVQQ